MAHKHSCGDRMLAALVLIGLSVWGINSCVESGDRAWRAEQARRAAITPEQRAAEDRAKAQARLAPNQLIITRQDFGDDWPFTVEEGILACKGRDGVGEVTFRTGGKTYGVNGLARGNRRYEEIDAIWAAHPTIPGAKKDIGPVLARGLKLCR